MDNFIKPIYQILQKLAGLHSQMLDLVRLEREALVEAELKSIQTITQSKQNLIEEIHRVETQRLKVTAELAQNLKKPLRDLTLPQIIEAVQTQQPKMAEELRTVYTTLALLIERISEQNLDNLALVQKSLEHIHQMKKNILEESVPKSNTYTQKGQKQGGPSTSKLISKEI